MTVEPDVPKTVFAGSPLILFGETTEVGEGKLLLAWNGPTAGSSEIKLAVPKETAPAGQTLRLLRGSRLITDADIQCVWGEDYGVAVRRELKRVDRKVQDLSEKYGLASRCMALVAVVEREGDIAGQVPETRVVPVGMPEDTSFNAYFRPSQTMMNATPRLYSVSEPDMCYSMAPSAPPRATQRRMVSFSLRKAPEAVRTMETEDILTELASRLEPDGGMPAQNEEERLAISLLVLLFFVESGHTAHRGAFRTHVQRLIRFMEDTDLTLLDEHLQKQVSSAMDHFRDGRCVVGHWKELIEELIQTDKPVAQRVWLELDRAL